MLAGERDEETTRRAGRATAMRLKPPHAGGTRKQGKQSKGDPSCMLLLAPRDGEIVILCDVCCLTTPWPAQRSGFPRHSLALPPATRR